MTAKGLFSSATATILFTIDDGAIISVESAQGVIGVPFIYRIIADRRAGCPSVRALNPLVTPAIEAIVKKLLAPEPKDRYQSAAALKTDLERHLNNLPLEAAREPSAFERLVPVTSNKRDLLRPADA